MAFGKEYTAAVEAKQVAAQEAERARILVDKAEQDKRSSIIRAEGEAQAAEMVGRAMENNPSFVTLRRIEAAREISNILHNSNNQIYLSADALLINPTSKYAYYYV